MKFLCSIPILALLAGCAHVDVQMVRFDPETKIVWTNRARATFFMNRELAQKLELCYQTKTSTRMIGAVGVSSQPDPEAIKALGSAMGDAAAEALRASMGLPPVPLHFP